MSDPDLTDLLTAADVLEQEGFGSRAADVRGYVYQQSGPATRLTGALKRVLLWVILLGGSGAATAGFVTLALRGDILAAAVTLFLVLVLFAGTAGLHTLFELVRQEANPGEFL